MRQTSISHCAIGQSAECADSDTVGCLSFNTGVATISRGMQIVSFDSEELAFRNEEMKKISQTGKRRFLSE